MKIVCRDNGQCPGISILINAEVADGQIPKTCIYDGSVEQKHIEISGFMILYASHPVVITLWENGEELLKISGLLSGWTHCPISLEKDCSLSISTDHPCDLSIAMTVSSW